jgi:NTP-dependent ternary conflict system VMAP-like protein
MSPGMRWRNRLSAALRETFQELDDGVREHIVGEMRRHAYDLPALPGELFVQCNLIIDALWTVEGGLNLLSRNLARVPGRSRSFITLVERTLPQDYLSPAERLEVISALEELIEPARLGDYYAEVTKNEHRPQLTSVTDLVEHIGQRTAPPGTRLDPLLHLIGAAARDSVDRTRGAECLQRAYEFAARIDGRRVQPDTTERQSSLLETVYRETRSADGTESVSAYVVFSLHPWSTRPDDHFFMSAWLFLGDSQMEKLETSKKALPLPKVQEETERIVNSAIQVAEQRHDNFTPVIEFFLHRSHLNLEVESWLVDHMPLGMQYVVVVRDWHRQDTKGGSARTRGKTKWRHLDASRPAPEVLKKWICCGEEARPEGELFRTLLQTEIAAAGLTFPPAPPAAEPHPFRDWELLSSGVPIAVWPHSCTHALNGSAPPPPAWPTEFRARLATAIDGRKIGELPQIVLELRQEVTQLDDPSQGLALLWEDPSRNVKPDDFKLAAPGAGGTS